MALAKELREAGGQLIFDKPWHCGLCRRRYRRRTLIEFWSKVVKSSDWFWKKEIIRLCAGDEVQPKGCAEMGFQQLFFRAKKQSRFTPRGRLPLVPVRKKA